MAEKHTTLAHAKQIALRTKVEVLALLVDALGGVQVGMTITLPVEDWEGRAQTIQNGSLLADNAFWYFVCPNDDCRKYGVAADDITTNGKITFRCETVPEDDITIHILRLEVET